eukprot:SM000229S07496  [mRNA]  locus=s229:77544:79509:+ [translate_table: standard]
MATGPPLAQRRDQLRRRQKLGCSISAPQFLPRTLTAGHLGRPPLGLAVYIVDFAITLLVFLALRAGMDSIPNISPLLQDPPTSYILAGLFGWFTFIHIFAPAGLVGGFVGHALTYLVVGVAAVAPPVLFPIFRDVLRSTPQTWLIGLQVIRIYGFLYLALRDMRLLPASFAVIVGYGDVLIAILAPVVANAFATKDRFSRQMGLVWNIAGLAFFLLANILDDRILGPYLQSQKVQRLATSYFYFTVSLLSLYAVPMLIAAHGYSLWKLMREKEAPPMMWTEDDDDRQVFEIGQ